MNEQRRDGGRPREGDGGKMRLIFFQSCGDRSLLFYAAMLFKGELRRARAVHSEVEEHRR